VPAAATRTRKICAGLQGLLDFQRGSGVDSCADAAPPYAATEAVGNGSGMTGVTQKAFHETGAHSLQDRGGLAVTLEDMFYLSQTIAAFAIVGSLFFVGMEVRSSNQVNRHRIIEELLADYRAAKAGVATPIAAAAAAAINTRRITIPFRCP